MTLRKNPIIKEEVLDRCLLVRQRSFTTKFNSKQCMYAIAALFVAGVTIWGIARVSGNGDIEVVKQRILGEVHLSNGKFSARTVNQLNMLSWENGLEILAVLDSINSSIKTMQGLKTDIKTDTKKVKGTIITLEKSEKELKTLLNDRKILEESAKHFKTSHLYTPVYEEYLLDTMSTLSSIKHPYKQQSNNLVQK